MNYQGTYFDGVSARRRTVTIALETELRLLDEAGEELAAWDYDGLVLQSGRKAGEEVRIAPKALSDARLIVRDHHFRNALISKAPQLFSLTGGYRLKRRDKILLGSATGVILLLLAVFVPGVNKLLINFVPDSWELALGENTKKLFFSDVKTCQDPATEARLQKLVRQLAGEEAARRHIRVSILDHRLVNAFALPGGEVVFTRGILESMQGPDEFAGVLAHEIAHQLENHPMQAQLRWQALGILLQLVFGDSELAADVGGLLTMTAFSRAMEAEADEIAVQLLAKENFTTQGLIDFFQTMMDKHGGAGGAGGLFQYLSTHPAMTERISALKEAPGGKRSAMPIAHWQVLKYSCR